MDTQEVQVFAERMIDAVLAAIGRTEDKFSIRLNEVDARIQAIQLNPGPAVDPKLINLAVVKEFNEMATTFIEGLRDA